VLTGESAGQTIALESLPVTIGRALDSDFAVDEAGVSRHHARIVPNAGGGYRVEDLHSTNGTFIGAARVGFALLERDTVLQLGPQLRIGFSIVTPPPEVLHLDERVARDAVTSVFERSYVVERLATEVARARDTRKDVALLMVGVDSLKAVNDHFGHFAGDRALASVAARIQRALRAEDILGRSVGDEFLVLAVETERGDVALLAERVRRAIAGLLMSARGREVRITASIGVATLGEVDERLDPAAAMLEMAEARMLAAKTAGRNQVSTAPPPRT